MTSTNSSAHATKSPTVFVFKGTPASSLHWDAWFTLALIIVAAVLLAKNKMPADMVFLGIDCILMLANIITTTEGLAGFSQSGMLTVAILMVAVQGIIQTGGLNYYATKILGKPKATGSALVRILSLAGFISSFVNDTPTFLLMYPVVQTWGSKLGIDVRTLILPLSFTVLLAGTMTLVGTSTNLSVQGVFVTQYPNATMEFFGITTAGAPVLFWGLAYVIVASEYLLPSKLKTSARAEFNQADGQIDSMTFRATVNLNSVSIGNTIAGAALRNLKVLYLFSVRRGEQIFHAVNPEFILQAEDELSFTGSPEAFVDVCKTAGLTPVTGGGSDNVGPRNETTSGASSTLIHGHLVTALVRDGSSLQNKTAKEIHFRSRFGASIVGMQRSGHKIGGEFSEVKFQVGDVLALLTDDSFDAFAPNVVADLKVVQLDSPPGLGDGYIVGAVVAPNSRIQFATTLGGKTIDEAKLRGLTDAFLIGITRKSTGEVVRNPPPSTIIHVGDVCWFTGNGLGVVRTVRNIPGLQLTSESQARKLKTDYTVERSLVEVVIAPRSFLIGSTARECRFRTRFGAAIVAVRRGLGNTPDDVLGTNVVDITFRVGDVLLLDASPDFIKTHDSNVNFLVMNTVTKSSPVQFGKFYLALGLFVSIFVVFIGTSSKVSLVPLGLAISGIMLAVGCMTPAQARAAVNWEVLVIIAAASGLSTALTKTGLASVIGGGFVQLSISSNGGLTGVIAALYISTMLVSLLVANNAAALIMFAIGVQVSKLYTDLDPLTMAYTTMVAASASFLIPYGYQTNILALSLGPYTTMEAIKLGFPLQMLLMPVSILALADMRGNWYPHVFVSVAVFVMAVMYKLFIHKGRKTVENTGLMADYNKRDELEPNDNNNTGGEAV